ncbi:MAG: hypothetical protein VXV96_12810 [Bdellovibrionota bacterium]|nr:hypothetical protein [Bdellovibrionota bacterium]
MKVNLKSLFQGRTKALSTLSLFALIGLSSALQYYSNQTTKVLALQDGLQTCFTRVHNSYTARLLGSGSEYLSESFVRTSEECMGEVIRVYEDLNLSNTVLLDDLNTMATDLSWFHQKITATETEGLFEGNPESVLLSNVGSRFEKLEIKKEEVNQGLVNAKNNINGIKANVGLLFYGVAALVPLLLVFDYFQRRKQEEVMEESESTARKLIKEGAEDSQVIQHLVIDTLNGIGLPNVAKVFELNRAKNISLQPEVEKEKDTVGKPIMLTGYSKKSSQDQAEKAWSQAELIEKRNANRESFELEDSISNVIDHISSKIFTLGIKLDTQTEPVKVYGNKESMEQALYNLFINAIDNYNFDDPQKFLRVSTRKLGSTVLVDLFDSGNEYDRDFLKQSKGLLEADEDFTDLAIAQSLIEENEAKISFENVANEDGAQVGRKVQLILEAVSEKAKKPGKRKLARVEKTTKRELLKRLAQAN